MLFLFIFSCTEYFDAAVTRAFQKNRSSVRILDAGAGRGSTASYLRSLGYNTIDALTVSKERLDNAERSGLYRNLLFTALKAESTLCATGAFDAVICADGVFPDEVDPDAIDEMLRLVKPGITFRTLVSIQEKCSGISVTGRCKAHCWVDLVIWGLFFQRGGGGGVEIPDSGLTVKDNVMYDISFLSSGDKAVQCHYFVFL